MSTAELLLADPEDFPESTASSPGIRDLTADPTPRHGRAVLDVVYAHRSGRDLRLHVLLPPGAAGPGEPVGATRYPCVLYVQGSAWHEQELGLNIPALVEFTRRGYAVALVEYRPSELAPFPAQARDARAAVRYVRAHADELQVDPDRLAMWGDSSGGHTTLMTYVTQDDPTWAEPGDEPNLGLRCFVDFYGPTDIARMNDEPSNQDHRGADSPEGMLIGGYDVLDHPELVAPTVVMNHVAPASQRPLRPLLVVHGSKDRTVPYAQSVLLHDALTAAGHDVRTYRLAGADHGGPPFWQDEVLDLVDAFLKENFA